VAKSIQVEMANPKRGVIREFTELNQVSKIFNRGSAP
jgi:hypothetical protein